MARLSCWVAGYIPRWLTRPQTGLRVAADAEYGNSADRDPRVTTKPHRHLKGYVIGLRDRQTVREKDGL